MRGALTLRNVADDRAALRAVAFHWAVDESVALIKRLIMQRGGVTGGKGSFLCSLMMVNYFVRMLEFSDEWGYEEVNLIL